jgi:hypothetical protein
MTQLVNHTAIEYEPDWNEETQQFEDICPFQANRRSNTYVCYCKNLQGESVYLKNKSQFDAHILVGYHRKALHKFMIQKMVSLKKELDRTRREKATLHVWVESEIARERRAHAETRTNLEKIQEKYMDDVIELNQKNDDIKRRLKKAEDLLHIQGEESAKYFINKN